MAVTTQGPEAPSYQVEAVAHTSGDEFTVSVVVDHVEVQRFAMRVEYLLQAREAVRTATEMQIIRERTMRAHEADCAAEAPRSRY
jgi:hypothetical protein